MTSHRFVLLSSPLLSHRFFSIFLQIWCAVGIDLSGSPSTTADASVDQLSQQLIESYHQMIDEQCLKLSSIVWIAAKSNDKAMITIIDSNKAEKIIDTFPLGSAIVYAMGSVPGQQHWSSLESEGKKVALGPSGTDYPPSDDSQWTLFEADTALASGETKTKEKEENARRPNQHLFPDVKVSPCTVASVSAGMGKSTNRRTRCGANLTLSARPSVSGTFPLELKESRSPGKVLHRSNLHD